MNARDLIVLKSNGCHFAFFLAVFDVYVSPDVGIKWVDMWFAELFFNLFFGHADFDVFKLILGELVSLSAAAVLAVFARYKHLAAAVENKA